MSTTRTTCSKIGCRSWVNNHYWSKINAAAVGWVFQKSGIAWCPDHTPEWYAEWKAMNP